MAMDKQAKMKIMEAIVDAVGSSSKDHGPYTVKRTFQMKKEWQEAMDKHNVLAAKAEKIATEAKNKLEKMEQELEGRKRIFWALIENDTQIFENMRFNEKTNEIEVIECDHDKDCGK